MVTDRPQFDVLANMRPAPERKPSEAERFRADVAWLWDQLDLAASLLEEARPTTKRDGGDFAENWRFRRSLLILRVKGGAGLIPARQQIEADTLRREIAALDKRIASLCLQVDWLSQRNSEAARLCREASQVVIDQNWQARLEGLCRLMREGLPRG